MGRVDLREAEPDGLAVEAADGPAAKAAERAADVLTGGRGLAAGVPEDKPGTGDRRHRLGQTLRGGPVDAGLVRGVARVAVAAVGRGVRARGRRRPSGG